MSKDHFFKKIVSLKSFDKLKIFRRFLVMAMIKMSPEEIRAKSQSYGQGSDQIRQILSDLTRAQGEIAANWEGQAFSRFEEQFQQLSPKVEKFAQLLEEIKQQLNSTADAVQEQDQQLSNNFGLQ